MIFFFISNFLCPLPVRKKSINYFWEKKEEIWNCELLSSLNPPSRNKRVCIKPYSASISSQIWAGLWLDCILITAALFKNDRFCTCEKTVTAMTSGAWISFRIPTIYNWMGTTWNLHLIYFKMLHSFYQEISKNQEISFAYNIIRTCKQDKTTDKKCTSLLFKNNNFKFYNAGWLFLKIK